MTCSLVDSTRVVNFSGFYSFLYEAIDRNQIHANKLIREHDKGTIVTQLQTYLIRNCGVFQLSGYCREGDIKEWFDYDVLLEEFDDLLLNFRGYLMTNLGLDLAQTYGLKRYLNNLTFILHGGQDDTALLYGQHLPAVGDCEPFLVEADPFL